jgi:hypothetical protein
MGSNVTLGTHVSQGVIFSRKRRTTFLGSRAGLKHDGGETVVAAGVSAEGGCAVRLEIVSRLGDSPGVLVVYNRPACDIVTYHRCDRHGLIFIY